MGAQAVPLNHQITLDPALTEWEGRSWSALCCVAGGAGVGSGVAATTGDCCSLVGWVVGDGVSPAYSLVTGRGVAVGWAARVVGGVLVLGMEVAMAVTAVVGVGAGEDVAVGGAGVGEDASLHAARNNVAPTTASPNTILRNLIGRC